MKKLHFIFAISTFLLTNLSYAEYTCADLKLKQCPNQVDKVLPNPHDMLTWTPEQRMIGFRNTYRIYDGSVFYADTKNILKLNKYKKVITNEDIKFELNNKDYDLNDYLVSQNVAGMIILKNGQIAYEYYKGDNDATTLWTSRSIAKSIVATLIGVAIQQKKINSLDTPIIEYLPDLKNTVWHNVTIRQLIQHTSGVHWSEDYKDPQSEFAKMTYCEVKADPDACVYDLVKNLKPEHAPGTVWSYNTGGAYLVGKILEAATKQNIASYLEQNVWTKVGMEKNGIWQSYQRGVTDMGGHGFNATLRDYARMGQFILDEGKLKNGKKILPNGWTALATDWTKAKNSVSKDYPNGIYGFQFWNSHAKHGKPLTTKNNNSTFWGFGIYGQIMAINPKDHIVMIQWSTWDTAMPSERIMDEKSLFLNSVTNFLSK